MCKREYHHLLARYVIQVFIQVFPNSNQQREHVHRKTHLLTCSVVYVWCWWSQDIWFESYFCRNTAHEKPSNVRQCRRSGLLQKGRIQKFRLSWRDPYWILEDLFHWLEAIVTVWQRLCSPVCTQTIKISSLFPLSGPGLPLNLRSIQK